ncbi:DeoR family myo-inositol catabolism operon transcriptional repressor [Lachnospiraceae bacterium PF1-21]|uniref:DeoR/GlpR family DNA-binding transcription regulator n=1 Tax=Ohessyouella blattaphilus TaxID=2949333 RepID=A0ABT1EJC0_9FIRM|nr:DeoR/GlpR family DNA-binding transcription regulator [Ohessyouella blattaphilus]MCP1109397.1 DeoR/GlpR family DNA-binding transcription regulator [Ohessyouella blattaphilus]MCR8562791.1 DeoR/GlpR family DNA-binding transcription regulator [Ohessyouella blattaphilus]MDL2249298.1 DeoR/GlpR family DNA-binding transcription regulator [Lachnospiraceae bacterium OttesenSCG-928-J05]
MRIERIDLIEEYILRSKNVTLDELCKEFNVSMNTIRRDINTLVKRGTVEKVYGGVTALDHTPHFETITPFTKRHAQLQEEKRQICQVAASFVEDGDVLYIDTGTTSLNLVNFIKDKTCTIITNSLQVALAAVPYPSLNVFSLPGKLRRDTLSFNGSEAESYLSRYNINKAFMCCTGLSIQNGATNATNEEYIVKKAVVESSQTRFLLADHTKFDKFTLMTFAKLSDLDQIISDAEPTAEYLEAFEHNNIQFHLANPSL